MIQETVYWFHQLMGHQGADILHHTIGQCYHHYLLRSTIDKYRCEHCCRHKLSGRDYGLLPQQEMWIAPWEEVAIDLIGPRTIKIHGKICEFSALNYIDIVSNLVELIRIDNKTAKYIRNKFVQSWLTRYPYPIMCVHDKGGEFIGSEFQWLLNMFSVKDILSTSMGPL